MPWRLLCRRCGALPTTSSSVGDLLAVDRSSNSAKGDSGPAEWLPADSGIRCAYSVRFAQVARKYALSVTRSDKLAMLKQCRRPYHR